MSATRSLGPLVLLGLAVLASCRGPQQPKATPPPPAQWPGPPRPPEYSSPTVSADGTVALRVFAPQAESVAVSSADFPGSQPMGPGLPMDRGPDGVWSATVGPVEPGAYRYRFEVDGLPVVDPRNPSTSESNADTWSLVCVTGSEITDTKEVPHGSMAQVTYYSRSLKRFRRMHIYTPPGYESGEGRFPVLYLLHGAFDSDASWPTVGRAGFILDNLIADGRARPMVVVMPAGHTGPFSFGAPGGPPGGLPVEEFVRDFTGDVRPHVESRYRVHADRAQRAIAGLSMGGMQALEIAFSDLRDYAYVGVFSAGIFGQGGGPGTLSGPNWETQHQEALANAELRQGLKLIWFATGKEDFLVDTSRSTVDMLKQHGFEVTYHESTGGHTWANWRRYLADFALLLFR